MTPQEEDLAKFMGWSPSHVDQWGLQWWLNDDKRMVREPALMRYVINDVVRLLKVPRNP